MVMPVACPHTRGDDPYTTANTLLSIGLVPIRVGMILDKKRGVKMDLSCPHTRGDDPDALWVGGQTNGLSPYAWG